jgi:AcrR family transcriptional regulator
VTSRASSGGEAGAQALRATTGRPYAGKLPAERRAERRRQFVETGRELFGTIGYADVTIERLCTEASVGIRAFYEEFGTRQALFRAVYDDVMDTAYAAMERSLSASASRPPAERLGACIRVYLRAMLEDRRCGRIVSIESGALGREMDAHRNATLKRFVALLVTALPAPVLEAIPNVRVWSLMLGGAVNEVVIDCLVARRTHDVATLADELTTIWNRTLPA